MAVDLTRIPGSGARQRPALLRRRGRRRGAAPPAGPAILSDPSATLGGERRLLRRRRLQLRPSDLLIVGGFAVVAAFLLWQGWAATRVPVSISGVVPGAGVTVEQAEGLEVVVEIGRSDSVPGATFAVNDSVPDPSVLDHTDTGFVWTPAALSEGTYEIVVTAPRLVLDSARFSWTFQVDGTAPVIDVPRPAAHVGVCEATTVSGTVEPGALLTLDGEEVDVDGDGRFELDFDRPPAHPLQLVAVDSAGNRSGTELVVPVAYLPNQGVHVTAAAWNHLPLRRSILDIVDSGLVSVVELDLKDEGGIVGYDTSVALAHTVGAVRDLFDLDEAVAMLHERGVRVIGRVVAFRDAPLASWAWEHGRPEMVVQTAGGDKLGAYGGFTNFAHPAVQQYNLDIALEGVEAGMDDILWDYVRRPEGSINDMRFPGLEGRPEDGVVDFLAFTGAALREQCAYQGASVFGIAADRPWAVGQDVGRIARHVDYIAPMLYPSHWVAGEYGVADPNRQPYDITRAALADFQAKAEGSGVAMVPWIQDFTYGHPYGPDEVRAQIDAAADLGVHDWLLWNASVVYTDDALDPALVATG